jgi:hypothetical protein
MANYAPLVKSMELGIVVGSYKTFHLNLISGLYESNMAAKIQDGRHIENFSDFRHYRTLVSTIATFRPFPSVLDIVNSRDVPIAVSNPDILR